MGIYFYDFVVLKLFAGTKFRENDQKLRKLRNLMPWKFSIFKVRSGGGEGVKRDLNKYSQ